MLGSGIINVTDLPSVFLCQCK